MKTVKKVHLRKWVIAGYSAFILIVAITIVYIAIMLLRFTHSDEVHKPVNEMTGIATATLIRLYEADAEALFAIASGKVEELSESSVYEYKIGEVYSMLNLLREHSTDSTAFERIDEIERLLSRKLENIVKLTEARLELDRLLSKSIDQEMKGKRPKIQANDVKIYDEKETIDTVIVKRPQKGFLKRLAEAFSPNKVDTVTRKNTTSRQQVDSLSKEYDPNKEVSTALLNLQRNIIRNRDEINARLSAQSADLLMDNQIITTQINQILLDIRDEETQIHIAHEAQRQNFVAGSITELSVIALLAIGVIIVFFILILREISKAKKLRSQLENARKFAEELLLSREKLMLMISHDVRAPLSSILSSASLLKTVESEAEREEYIDNMSASANHTLSLVNDLLEFHRIESGKIEINPQTFPVAELFTDIYLCFKPLGEAKGLKLKLDIDKNAAESYYVGDPLRIKQATGNLLSNAIKFTPSGSVYLNVWNEPRDDDGSLSCLCISVRDEGPGIAESEQEKVFSEFTRLEGSESTEGFGLGLSISNKLVSLMNGVIRLESQPGKGAEFIIKMSLAEVSAPDSRTATEVAERQEESDMNVLVIDDDAIQLKYLESLFRQHNISVTACSKVDEVLNHLRKASFKLILTDMQMPEMNGTALLKHIRTSGIKGTDSIAVVAVTASTAEKTEYYTGIGFNGYLCKPVTPAALMQLVNSFGHFPEAKKESVQSINLAALTAFIDEDEEKKAIVKTFVAETSKSLALLRKSFADEDRRSVARIAHKLAPTMKMIEARDTVEKLSVLETSYQKLSNAKWKNTAKECINMIEAIVKSVNV